MDRSRGLKRRNKHRRLHRAAQALRGSPHPTRVLDHLATDANRIGVLRAQNLFGLKRLDNAAAREGYNSNLLFDVV